MSDPVVDVLVTVWNGASTIQKSILSIQQQTLENIRIFIVDDGSTDETLNILQAIAHEDKRVHILAKPHSGIVDSVNLGLANCTAQFIARFDADDISYPTRLATQANYLQAHPDCLAVSCTYIHIDENDLPVGDIVSPAPIEQSDPNWIPAREPFLLQPLLMLRRSGLIAVGGYRLCEVSEDSDLYWRLQEIGEIVNLEEVLGAYRINPHSVSSKSIVHGRRMALWSQLVGISALRRRQAKPDLVFDQERLNSYRNVTTLQEFCDKGSIGLNENEKKRLYIAVSTKLFKLAHFRPFEIDQEDCRFIRKSLRQGDYLLSDENRQEIKSNLTSCGIRLIAAGKFAEAYFLLKTDIIYVCFLALIKALLPNFLRQFLKSALRKAPSSNKAIAS